MYVGLMSVPSLPFSVNASQSMWGRQVSRWAMPCWELYCLEHGIQPDGQMPSDKTIGGGTATPSPPFL